MVFDGCRISGYFFKSEVLMKNKNKILIVSLLILIFIIPLILSRALYDYHSYFHLKTTNHGTLIDPPIGMPKTKKWQIIYISSGHCDQFCLTMRHNLRQVKLALGKNSLRVNVTFIDAPVPKEWIKAFGLRYKNKFSVSDKIYLMDPEGNILMYYPSHTDPMNILKDLKHLLEVSQIG
jgi:hypothetical protein